MGAAKPMSARRQLLAANPARDFRRPNLGKPDGRSLTLRDMMTTTTPSSFDTMMSPQRRRRGKKPGTKLIPLSPSTASTPRSPTTRRDAQKHTDARHRSTSCEQPPSSDRPRPRSLSTLKSRRVRSLSRSNPYEIEVTGSSGKEDEKAVLPRSRSRQSSSSHSSLTRHLNETDAPPRGHQPPPLPGLPCRCRRGSGRLDSPSSSQCHYLKSPSSISRLPKSSPTTTTRLQSLRSISMQRVRTAVILSPEHRSQRMKSLYMDANERPPRADPILKTPSRVEQKPSQPAVLTQLFRPSSTSSLDEILRTGRRSSTTVGNRRFDVVNPNANPATKLCNPTTLCTMGHHHSILPGKTKLHP